MKKVFLGLLVIASFAACKSTETKPTETVEASSEKVEHLYKPTYTDNFKIGDQTNVLLAEQFHKLIFEKDFKAVAEMMSDTATYNVEDGSVLKGKAAIMEFVEKSLGAVTITNYQITAIFPVVGEQPVNVELVAFRLMTSVGLVQTGAHEGSFNTFTLSFKTHCVLVVLVAVTVYITSFVEETFTFPVLLEAVFV